MMHKCVELTNRGFIVTKLYRLYISNSEPFDMNDINRHWSHEVLLHYFKSLHTSSWENICILNVSLVKRLHEVNVLNLTPNGNMCKKENVPLRYNIFSAALEF